MANLVVLFRQYFIFVLGFVGMLLIPYLLINHEIIVNWWPSFQLNSDKRATTDNYMSKVFSKKGYKLLDKLDINWPEKINRSTQPFEQAYAPSGYIPRSQTSWGNCTMETCIDWSRPGCRREMPLLIYIYPCVKPQCFLQSVKHNIITKSLQNELKHLLTSNPDEACFFYHTEGLSAQLANQSGDKQAWRKMLQSLPFWNNTGANHIYFKFKDYDYYFNDLSSPPNRFQDHIDKKQMAKWKRQWDASIMVDSNAAYGNFRSGFDVTTPLIPIISHQTRRRLNYASTSFPRKTDKYLLTFKGKVYDTNSVRRVARDRLHNGVDVIVVGRSWDSCPWRRNMSLYKQIIHNISIEKQQRDKECAQEEANYDNYDYIDLLTNSTFSLCARGRGRHIYRLLESISVGTIPVIISDDNHLPFSEFIDWREFSFRFYESDILRVVPFLRTVTHERIIRMKQRAVNIFERFFSNKREPALYIFNIIQQRANEARKNLNKSRKLSTIHR